MTKMDPMVAAVFRRRAEIARREAVATRTRHLAARAEVIAERMRRLPLDRTMRPDAITVGLTLLQHRADHPGSPLPSRETLGTALGLTPYAVAMAAYDLDRGGYLN